MSKKRDHTKENFQVLEHNNSDSLNTLLRDPKVMAAFQEPFEHNQLDILYDADNNGLHIMQAHNKFIEYLKSRANMNL